MYGTSQAITISDILSYTGPAPTGAVMYVLNGTTYTATCGTSSPATCTATVPAATVGTLPVGTYTVTAAIAAAGNYKAASGTSATFTITAIAPTVATVSAATAPYGSTTGITVTATESGTAGAVTGGVVTFSVTGAATGTFSPATCTLSATGTCTTTYTPTGTLAANTYANDIIASFAANNGYLAATGTGTLTITTIAPTAATVSAVSTTFGSTTGITVTASETGPNGGVSGGIVTFGTAGSVGGSFTPATCTLGSSGTCTSTYTPSGSLAAGTYPSDITASFAATGSFIAASGSATLTVAKGTPTIMLVASPNPVLVQNTVTLTATVLGNGGPTGTVNFYDNTTNTSLGNSPIFSGGASNGGPAFIYVSSLAIGTHSITATYQNDPNFITVTSNAVSELVEDFSLSVSTANGSITSATIVPGATATYLLNISPIGASTFPANVALSVSGLPTGATYTVTPSTIASGSGATTVTLAVTAPVNQSQLERRNLGGSGLVSVAFGLCLLPFSRRFRKQLHGLGRVVMVGLLLLAGAGAMAGLSGCGTSTGFFGQAQKTYTVTLTGTSGALSHSTTVTLTVE